MGRIVVGTSGFSYREWKPAFYPEGTSDKKFLSYYATRFPGVEIDGTFYRMPSAASIDRWQAETPESFRFAVKASQKSTHFERLKVPSDSTEYFTQIVATLGERLGTVLFQLPPNMKRNDERLASFLASLPASLPRAFEFRNASWFDPAIFDMLRAHHATLCCNDSDESTTPLELTGPHVYLRLRKTSYDAAAFDVWESRLREWAAAGKDVFAFIKHEDNPEAAQIALSFWSRFANG